MDNRGSIRVLVVEDHGMVAETFERVFSEEEGIEVVGLAGTAAEALKLLGEHPVDVAVVDWVLPDGDGIALIPAILECRPEARVLLVTGSGGPDWLLSRAMEAGSSGYLEKTAPLGELVAAVRAVHAGRVVIPPDRIADLVPRLRRGYREPGDDLTDREREVLSLLAEGVSNRAIAERLVVSIHTVRNHVQSILGKLDAHSKLEAVAKARTVGLIDQ